ncbi:hypothetical protein DM01DRAFT_1347999 [Hesseltinella vesiculosa]|uniref:BZIP domain-containing protein n=1 Tax=Hesseltinella vesiculosa TaxID=101127 RepID=A0A1X2GAQ2_9FUNG|nr:hypothetical protein DM01DRAFT_1347999 [Hesseltinella vesiculosa]
MSNEKRRRIVTTESDVNDTQLSQVERRKKQNRIAQMNFRIRKELYVKELEIKVQDMEQLKERLEQLEKENARLTHRIWELEHPSGSPPPTTSPSNAKYLSAPAYTRPAFAASFESNTLPPPRQIQLEPHPHQTANATSTLRDHPHPIYATSPTSSTNSLPASTPNQDGHSPSSTPPSLPTTPSLGSPGKSSITSLPILPPPTPSASSSVFRPVPIAHWEKESNQRQQRHDRPLHPESSSDHGRVLDDLASILRTRHRPPLRQPEQTTTNV